MKQRVLGVVLAAALAGCDSSTRHYDNNDAELSVGYAAKEVCSCLFVMGQSEEYCRAWTRASPAVARVHIDKLRKSVEASALLLWGMKAHYAGEHFGCVIDE